MNATISIITVSFRSAATIADTCKSITAQTYPKIQHIIVDGGSPDATVEIARRHAHPQAIIVSEPDKGIYDAMNKGLKLATGDVVGFLNADDTYADTRTLAFIAAAFQRQDTDAVFGDLVYVPQDGSSSIVRYWNASRFRSGSFAFGLMPPHPTFYVRRSLLERHGPFRLDLAMANDFEFCARWLARGRVRARYIPRILVKMKMGGESNRSWRNVIRQNVCIFRALRLNQMSMSLLLPIVKFCDRARQFLSRPSTKVL